MGEICDLGEIRRQPRRPPKPTFFSRAELNQLLSLYSRRVMSGEWRDYAIDQRGGMAVFSVFRHAHDRPLFAIAKRISGPGRQAEYLVFGTRQGLRRTTTIAEALSYFERRLKIVS